MNFVQWKMFPVQLMLLLFSTCMKGVVIYNVTDLLFKFGLDHSIFMLHDVLVPQNMNEASVINTTWY